MLTVHHLNNSRSQRVLWLLEELGAPYEIARYQRQPDMRGSSAVPVVASMLKRAPQAYVSFEAFIFVSGPILFVECLIMLFDNALMSARKRKSSQPSEASKR